MTRAKVLHTVSLFSSFSTLICCALPALLVVLGLGATLAGIVSSFPALIWLSEHKVLTFSISGFLLSCSGISIYMSRYVACPADKEKAEACSKMKKVGKYIFLFSLILYCTGFFFAFIAPKIFS